MRFLKITATLFCLLGALFWTAPVPAQTHSSDTAGISQPAETLDDHAADKFSSSAPTHANGHANLGEILPLWSCIPFAGMLLSIALMPLLLANFLASSFRQDLRFLGRNVRHSLFMGIQKRRPVRDPAYHPGGLCAVYHPPLVALYDFRRHSTTGLPAGDTGREYHHTDYRRPFWLPGWEPPERPCS